MSFLLLSACEKSQCGFGEEASIMDKWKWVEISGGFGGIVETPVNTANNISLELLPNGTYILTRNKVMAQQGNYTSDSQFCYHHNRTKSALQLDSNEAKTKEFLDTGKLVLADEYADGLTYNVLLKICARCVTNRMDAESLLNDSFLKIFSHLEGYQFKGSFQGWMKRITANTCLDFLRTKEWTQSRKIVQMSDIHSGVGSHLEGDIIQDLEFKALLKMIQQLPDTMRMVLS
jgi:hypothetical protein